MAERHEGAPAKLSLETMRADLAEVLYLDPSEVPDDADLLDLGLDSIRLMSLGQRWSDATGARVTFADLAVRPQLPHWWRLLNGLPEAEP